MLAASCSPAKAGVQARRAASNALPRVFLLDWAPAFAGERRSINERPPPHRRPDGRLVSRTRSVADVGRGRGRCAGEPWPPRHPHRHGSRCRAAARRGEARSRVQCAARHAGRGRLGAGDARSDGAALHPLGHGDLGDRNRQGADQAGARAPRRADARRPDRQERKPVRRRSAGAALCAQACQRRLVGRCRHRHCRGQLRQPDRPRCARTVAGIRRAARRTLCPWPRADDGGARRGGARRHRTAPQERLLRLRRQIYRRDDRSHLPRRRA